MSFKFVTLFLILINSNSSFAHGMNKHGPHGGYIKMPGALHTELVDKGQKMHVYLLDMLFKNPMTTNSSVKIKYLGKTEVEFTCIKNVDHFVCDKPKDFFNNYKEVILTTVRNNSKSKEANYSLPLKLDK